MKKSMKIIAIVLALSVVLALAVGFVACNKGEKDEKPANTPADTQDSSSVVLSMDDIKGKTVACIGQGAVPGRTFEYILVQNGIEVITEGTPNANQVKIVWAADGAAANAALVNGSADFAVVGEPAATTFSNKFGYNAIMDLQSEYAKCDGNNGDTYPQAGIFVKHDLAKDMTFISQLFSALRANKTWVLENKASVTAYMQANLYQSANFPAASLERCALSAKSADTNEGARIIAFLSNIMPNVNWASEENVGKLATPDGTNTHNFTAETVLRFAAPEGTPALAIGHMVTDSPTISGATMQYAVVAPANIATEMASGSADIVIMPINAGANLIVNRGADYKLVGVAVDGSLFLIGNKNN